MTNAASGAKILDLATGTGKQAFAFARRGYEVVGLDLSPNMLDVAKRNNRYQNLRFELADASDIPFSDSYFDVSCISFALHEMPPAVREKVIKEMVRVTRLAGIIVFIDYARPESKIWSYLVYHFIRYWESKFYSQFVNYKLEALIEKLGIKVKEMVPVVAGAGKIYKGINQKKSIFLKEVKK